MEQVKLCASDYRFMTIVWESEPVPSGELVRLCADKLGWKKSTTYTMVKKLAQKGYLANENSVVRALIPKADVLSYESEYVVDNAFSGSLPAFVASFTRDRTLTKGEAEEIRRLIDSVTED